MHADAVLVLKMEVGRLKCCAASPGWAKVREKVLARCQRIEATIKTLEHA
jgi:hypothetical protein